MKQNKYNLGKRSREALSSCHVDLQLIAEIAIKRTQVDFMIVEGHRSKERQKLLYDAGKSKIDGIKKKGKHNYSPSLAFDICAIVKGKASWRESYLAYLGGVITSVALELIDRDHIGHRIRWGGNWDGDGEIITDQSFIDMPHFELIKI